MEPIVDQKPTEIKDKSAKPKYMQIAENWGWELKMPPPPPTEK